MDRLTISTWGKTTVSLLPSSNDIPGGNTHGGKRSDWLNVKRTRWARAGAVSESSLSIKWYTIVQNVLANCSSELTWILKMESSQ